VGFGSAHTISEKTTRAPMMLARSWAGTWSNVARRAIALPEASGGPSIRPIAEVSDKYFFGMP
jgi:hypothetical protein